MGPRVDNLALLLSNEGKYGEAESLYRRALDIRENALGERHPEMATSLDNLALLLSNEGKYGEAESLYRRAFACCGKSVGERQPEMAHRLDKLSVLPKHQRWTPNTRSLLHP